MTPLGGNTHTHTHTHTHTGTQAHKHSCVYSWHGLIVMSLNANFFYKNYTFWLWWFAVSVSHTCGGQRTTFQESILSFQHVSSGDGTSISSLVASVFAGWAILPAYFSYNITGILRSWKVCLPHRWWISQCLWNGRCFLYVSCMTFEPHSSSDSQWHYRLFRESDHPRHCSAGSWSRRTLVIDVQGSGMLWGLLSGLTRSSLFSEQQYYSHCGDISHLAKCIPLLFVFMPGALWVVGSAHLMSCLPCVLGSDHNVSICLMCLSLSRVKCPPCTFLASYSFYTWSNHGFLPVVRLILEESAILCMERNTQCNRYFIQCPAYEFWKDQC